MDIFRKLLSNRNGNSLKNYITRKKYKCKRNKKCRASIKKSRKKLKFRPIRKTKRSNTFDK